MRKQEIQSGLALSIFIPYDMYPQNPLGHVDIWYWASLFLLWYLCIYYPCPPPLRSYPWSHLNRTGQDFPWDLLMHDFHKDFVLQKEVTATAHCTKMAEGCFCKFWPLKIWFCLLAEHIFLAKMQFPPPFWLLKISHLLWLATLWCSLKIKAWFDSNVSDSCLYCLAFLRSLGKGSHKVVWYDLKGLKRNHETSNTLSVHLFLSWKTFSSDFQSIQMKFLCLFSFTLWSAPITRIKLQEWRWHTRDRIF